MNYKFILILILFLIIFSSVTYALNFQAIDLLNYEVTAEYPHDDQAFTQGLEIYNNHLYEGTGLYGKSSLRKIEIESAKILKKIKLNKKYFGEGITILNNKIYQLSWKENTAFVYDLDFNLIKTFKYKNQGWGLSNNGESLIMSSGSQFLTFRDPQTFKINKKIEVKINNKALKNINELEYLDGLIYANIWQTDYIVIIDAHSGAVQSYLDLSNILAKKYENKAGVLNGIAYDPKNKNFLITGKLWPKVYRINIIQ